MIKKIAVLAIATVYLSGCTTTDPYTGQQKMSNTAGGALIGAGLGAATGLLVGGSSAGRRDAALVGAGIGALGGGLIGNYMDSQETELRAQLQNTGVSVTRVGDRIVLNMPSNITFPSDGDSIRSEFYPVLNSVAIVLAKYDRSAVDVDGHTDSQGSDSYNLDLSRRRAESVADYLASQRVNGRRLNVQGFGESRPVGPNDSEYGRAQNRRVEVSISPYSQG